MRIKRVIVSSEIILDILKTCSVKEVSCEGLPLDSHFRGMVHDLTTNSFVVFAEHESFDDVPQNGPVPLLEVEFSVKNKNVPKPLILVP